MRCFLLDSFCKGGRLARIVKAMETPPSTVSELPSGDEKPRSLEKFSTVFMASFSWRVHSLLCFASVKLF